ncbi:glycerol-3-phosphate dehydrogenase (NAD(P)+) [Humidesulfovibrio mexicanus]|uniref:Glycerol-3-phosphate dehydrogenase [NAD(P)+] n=1 Tax=Humidesulfovibrio mexicanus TaxID=147047 RepID=A0A239BHL8_9BACT|nr:NAD(P)H-dependent glycerol-3-phosphate dehydrogenase [Humidesulfovibrio mexicanus]SNS06614.1 glycerol-3-phosphate dehydrogenase (NAD(P)+) [Humidesulfovibrio mexicanus]
MKTAVIGAGSWGTTLADLLAKKGVPTTLWVREPELLAEMKETGRNTWFLPDIQLCPDLQLHANPARAFAGAKVFLLVVPSQFMRASLTSFRDILPKRPVMVCASKGIENGTLAPMSQVVAEALDGLSPRYAALSGPSFAKEVSLGMPTTVSLGCADKKLGRELQALFSTETFRVYTNPDFLGVELGGALKNVMAIGAGIADGLGFGHDARAALITRGLAEMSRLGKVMGAKPKTFMGLSGMGDLVLTCTGDLSRNRTVGMKLGQGRKLADILAETKTVAEGVRTTQSVFQLSRKLGVELPLTEQVYRILYEDKDPAQAVRDLMTRELKDE